ncbi:myelin-associated glycoprotein-like isoform X3 [Sphaeramia orbicularis]|uniref:myelin-associated glycoprotein-like isoform X3 n=1 Tax=Sphaeramia orbicularis TaxID=375764 RepID=UPI00117EDBBA|nr:myelin-associated glycoprotein-like isoform X3 [Sphaeramia orbicularis]
MAGALNILLTICLLHGVLSADFRVVLPKTIEAVAGSCVTIPCSFETQDQYEKDLDDTCVAKWRKGAYHKSTSDITPGFITTATTGDLKKKTCTSTINNIQIADGGTYFFRLDCKNPLMYNFPSGVNINVKADPPKPTLSPSELEVEEGASVSLQCSAPAPCPSLRPTVTWTPSLGTSQETLMDNQDKTKVIKSVLNFTASHLHHGQRFSCTAVYRRQDNRVESSVSKGLTAHVKFAPQILSSSNCTKAAATVSCSCSTVGNPSPRLQWYLDGLSVNHSDKVDISSESLNGTGLRSTITVNLPQKLDLSTLFRHSRNSVGSTVGQFYFYTFEQQTPVVGQGQGMFPALITTVGVLLILVCVLLFVIRTLKTRPTHPSTVTMNQLLDGNDEVPSATERNIYANTNVLSQEHESTPGDTNSLSDNAEGGKSSENKQGGGEVIYSSVIWKSKKEKKKEDRDDARPSCSYLEEERCMMGDVCKDFVSNAIDMGNQYDDREHKTAKEVECEYAQVKYKVKSTNNQ